MSLYEEETYLTFSESTLSLLNIDREELDSLTEVSKGVVQTRNNLANQPLLLKRVMQNQQQMVNKKINDIISKKLTAVAMNKRQIPNGSKNTVNALKQAQKPLKIRR